MASSSTVCARCCRRASMIFSRASGSSGRPVPSALCSAPMPATVEHELCAGDLDRPDVSAGPVVHSDPPAPHRPQAPQRPAQEPCAPPRFVPGAAAAPSSRLTDDPGGSVPKLAPGDPAPDFTLPTADGSTITLSHLRGRHVVVYFYPRASTPGCTTQACDFRHSLFSLQPAIYTVLSVSPDNPGALAVFAGDESLTFPLLSDPDH